MKEMQIQTTISYFVLGNIYQIRNTYILYMYVYACIYMHVHICMCVYTYHMHTHKYEYTYMTNVAENGS